MIFIFLILYLKAIDYFYVYSSCKDEINRFSPSGFMGDVNDFYLTHDYKIRSPLKCSRGSLKIKYEPKGEKGWAGIYFLHPPNNWGNIREGYNLTGATEIIFYAKGKKGGEKISLIKIGGLTGRYPDSDTMQIGPLRLSKKWKRFTIDISKMNLRYIAGGFCVILKKEDNPKGCTIYLDGIAYRGGRIYALKTLGDDVPPKLSIKLSSNELNLGKNLDIFLEAKDNRVVKEWSLKILNQERNEIKIWQGSSDPPKKIIWDGKDDIYKKYVPSGEYTFIFKAKDEAGNVSEVQSKVVVKKKEKKEYKKIKIVESEKGLRVRLKSDILFGIGKYKLKKEVYPILDELVELLKEYPENKILIEGHTDSVGSEGYNLKLSIKRAKEVRNYLVKKGISSERIKVVGYGEKKPIASNKTRHGRALNRRVEVIILKK
ncbi:MAG: hypothetical protein DRI36_00085 [Caldiserica bacterium]|nr:MAG: hypothetical protein DRI36_00085 [Caldisericota bacterium]